MKSRIFTYEVLKSLKAFGLAFLLVVICQGLAAQGINLIPNSSLEDDPTSIAPFADWGGCSISTDEAHTGTQSLLVTSAGWGGGAFEVRGGLYKGREYTYTAWAKLSEPSSEWVMLSFQGFFGGGSDEAHKWTGSNSAFLTATEWTEMTNTFAIEKDSVDVMLAWFGTGITTSALWYLDDFKLICSNMAVNSGFEDQKLWDLKGTTDEIKLTGLAANIHSGSVAVKVTPQTDDGAGFGQTIPIPLEGGKTYTFSAFCKPKIENSGAKIVATFRDRFASPETDFDSETVSTEIVYSADGYQETKMTFKVPEYKDSVYIGVWCPTKDETIVFDDFRLMETTDDVTVGVVDLFESSVNVSLFPNPLKGTQLNVVTTGLTGNKSLDIYDIAGKLVFNTKLQDTDQQLVDVSAAKMKGVYIVCVSGKEGKSNQKLIMQ